MKRHRHHWGWRKRLGGAYRWICLRCDALPDRRQLARITEKDAETQRIRSLRFGHESGERGGLPL